MRILILTHLYPDQNPETPRNQTPAVHEFAMRWNAGKADRALVVKLHHFPMDREKLVKKPDYIRDGVQVKNTNCIDSKIYKYRFKNLKCFSYYLRERFTPAGLDRVNLKSLVKIIKQENFAPDIVLTHGMISFKQAGQVAQYFRVPLILAFHGMDVKNYFRSKKWNAFIRAQLKKADAWVGRSPWITRKLQGEGGFDKMPHFTAFSGSIPEEIQTENFFLDKLKSWKTQNKKLILLSACTLIPLKNIDSNLRALAQLHGKIDFEYHILGEGKESRALQELSRSLGLQDKVVFHGKLTRTQTLDMMQQSHIFLMISAPETFGLAYLEALSQGNIVIGAEANGIDGFAESEKEAFFISPEKPEQLASLIEQIYFEMSYDQLREILLNARKLMLKNTKEAVAARYLDFIKSCQSH